MNWIHKKNGWTSLNVFLCQELTENWMWPSIENIISSTHRKVKVTSIDRDKKRTCFCFQCNCIITWICFSFLIMLLFFSFFLFVFTFIVRWPCSGKAKEPIHYIHRTETSNKSLKHTRTINKHQYKHSHKQPRSCTNTECCCCTKHTVAPVHQANACIKTEW